MTARKVMIATTSFASADLEALVGKHPAVLAPGVIQQRTRLFADDPIVVAHPTLFVDAATVPGPDDGGGASVRAQRTGTSSEWLAIVKAYRRCQAKGAQRPSQGQVANAMGFDTEQPLRDRLRAIGIADWRAVHARIAADDEG